MEEKYKGKYMQRPGFLGEENKLDQRSWTFNNCCLSCNIFQ